MMRWRNDHADPVTHSFFKEDFLMTKRFRWTAVIAAVLMLNVASAFGPATARAEVRFGTVPRTNAAALQKMFQPLADYLTAEIGEKVTVVIPKDFESVKTDAKEGKMDIGFVNPLLYVQIKKIIDIEPLALSSEVKSGTRLRGIIVVRKDSGINELKDLKGKKFMFVEEDSPAGHIFQKLLLSRAGFDVDKDVVMLPFGKSHENVVKAVFDRTADAGGVREEQLDKMKGTLDVSQLKIVGYSNYFPNWPMFASPNLKRETAGKIRAALLKLKPNDPKNEQILGPARLTGFIPVTDKEYDDLRAAAKLVGAY
jgi:phosphonate transport system substrate-binding protein